MRVQRAPGAAEQPVPGRSRSPFWAEVELDLTSAAGRLDRAGLVAAVVVPLLSACRREGLLGDAAPVRFARWSAGALVGEYLEAAWQKNASAVGSAFGALGSDLAAASAQTLTVIDLGDNGVRAAAGWACGGWGVITLGPAAPVVQPGHQDGEIIFRRRALARLTFEVTDGSDRSGAVVRALETVAASFTP